SQPADLRAPPPCAAPHPPIMASLHRPQLSPWAVPRTRRKQGPPARVPRETLERLARRRPDPAHESPRGPPGCSTCAAPHPSSMTSPATATPRPLHAPALSCVLPSAHRRPTSPTINPRTSGLLHPAPRRIP